MTVRFVIASDNGESWVLDGDDEEEKFSADKDALPTLVAEGYKVESITPGSGSKDDASYWLLMLSK